MLVRLPCLEPIMTTTTRPPRPPVPPSADPAVPLSLPDAEALGERIQAQAALVAGATCQFLLMLADFDARGGVGWFVGLNSTAHWLAWACSMSPGAAREHVRVARALPSMPLTVTEFQAGRLSYSKVREISRVIDRVDEQTLVEMARAMTASQLARPISSVRAVDGTRPGQDAVRHAHCRRAHAPRRPPADAGGGEPPGRCRATRSCPRSKSRLRSSAGSSTATPGTVSSCAAAISRLSMSSSSCTRPPSVPADATAASTSTDRKSVVLGKECRSRWAPGGQEERTTSRRDEAGWVKEADEG